QPRTRRGARGRGDGRADAAPALRRLPRDAGLLLRQADAGERVRHLRHGRAEAGPHGLTMEADTTVGERAPPAPSGGLARVPLLAAVAEKFRQRPDSEHEMTINRLVIAVLIMSYLLVTLALDGPGVHEALVVISVFSAFSVGFFVHILLWPGVSVPRRVLA